MMRNDVIVMTPLDTSLGTTKDDIFQISLVTRALGHALLGLSFFHEADKI